MYMNNILLAILLLGVVYYITVRREPFTEVFGFSGYTKPSEGIFISDPIENLSTYTPVEAKIDHDTMEKLILATNKAISDKAGVCNYIIETTSLKKFVGKGNDVYRVMFMAVKNHGFAYGFAVTVDAMIDKSGNVIIKSLRTQPIDADIPNDIKAFTNDEAGQEFIEYKLVKDAAVPTRSEFDLAKNKLR